MKIPKSETPMPHETRNPKPETRNMITLRHWSRVAFCFLFSAVCYPTAALTAFTYQGRLEESGTPANGLYDFRAHVYNRAVAGEPGDALVSSTLTLTAVPVTNGLFVLNLDCGAAPFNGEARWLALVVRTNNALNYMSLAPRPPLTATPYAILAGNVGGTVAAANIDPAIARDNEVFSTVLEETQIFTSHFGGHSTIGGGNYNRIFGQFATIVGGATNKAYGIMTAGTVGGGVNNEAWHGDTVSGGGNNVANGGGATVPGGYQNQATGSRSFAAGYQARASHARSFVWSSRDNPAPSFATNRFHVHASEGFSVDYARQRLDGGGQRWVVLGGYSDFPGQTISAWNGARLTDGGVWADNSDRNAKENFADVSGREILEKVAALPVLTWNYTAEGPDVRHIGPVAQDFCEAFHTGADDKHLAALDSAGVALAAIQGLNQKLEEQLRRKDAQLASQQWQIAALLERLDVLEQKLNTSEPK
jgi:hypothetical protein